MSITSRSAQCETMTDFDSRAFRNALGDFPTGVAIVTTMTDDGEELGITVSSFNSVSLDPPLVLFSIGKNAKGLSKWLSVGSFAINVLHEGQYNLSSKFGRAAHDKWDGVAHAVGACGVRVISDALTVFECKTFAQYEGGDHIIIVGQVISLSRSPQPSQPLVFFRGGYRSLASIMD